MTDKRRHRRTHLFTVRLWLETTAGDRAELRGRVQHVLGGDVRYFRSWQALTNFLDETLRNSEGSQTAWSGDNDH